MKKGKNNFSKGAISSTSAASDGLFRFSTSNTKFHHVVDNEDHDDTIIVQSEEENESISNNNHSINNNEIVIHSEDVLLPKDNSNHIVNNNIVNDDDDANDYDDSIILDAIHHHSSYQQQNRYSCYVGIAIIILSFYTISITILYWNNLRLVRQQQQQQQQMTSESQETNIVNRFSILLNTTIPIWKSLPSFDTQLTQIVFGSCAQQNVPQTYWDTILSTYSSSPDMFLLMGDNIYGDCSNEMYQYNIDGNNYIDLQQQYNECIELKIGYQTMANHPSIIGAANKISVLPTLDDHDYGINDCHMYNPFKDIAQQYFLEFFQIPTKASTSTQQCSVSGSCIPLAISSMDSDDHNEIKDGVFRSGIWGTTSEDLVQIIILDTRYWRSPFIKTGNSHSPYTPYTEEECISTNNNDTMKPPQMLSERQWIWLEEQMKHKAVLRFIVSSIQVLNNTTGFECWRHIPTEQRRLYNIIYKTTLYDSSRTIILSGDRHVGGYYEYNYKPTFTDDDSNEYVTISEITSSSLTHSEPYSAYHPNCTTSDCADEYDPNRITDFIRENLFGTISIDWSNNTIDIDLRKADNSYGSTYHGPNTGDSGKILQSKTYTFPCC